MAAWRTSKGKKCSVAADERADVLGRPTLPSARPPRPRRRSGRRATRAGSRAAVPRRARRRCRTGGPPPCGPAGGPRLERPQQGRPRCRSPCRPGPRPRRRGAPPSRRRACSSGRAARGSPTWPTVRTAWQRTRRERSLQCGDRGVQPVEVAAAPDEVQPPHAPRRQQAVGAARGLAQRAVLAQQLDQLLGRLAAHLAEQLHDEVVQVASRAAGRRGQPGAAPRRPRCPPRSRRA